MTCTQEIEESVAAPAVAAVMPSPPEPAAPAVVEKEEEEEEEQDEIPAMSQQEKVGFLLSLCLYANYLYAARFSYNWLFCHKSQKNRK